MFNIVRVLERGRVRERGGEKKCSEKEASGLIIKHFPFCKFAWGGGCYPLSRVCTLCCVSITGLQADYQGEKHKSTDISCTFVLGTTRSFAPLLGRTSTPTFSNTLLIWIPWGRLLFLQSGDKNRAITPSFLLQNNSNFRELKFNVSAVLHQSMLSTGILKRVIHSCCLRIF